MSDWITTDKQSGRGDSKVRATVAPNAGKDRAADLVIRTAKNTVVRVSIANPGIREEFNLKDGILNCAGSGEFLTLKQ